MNLGKLVETPPEFHGMNLTDIAKQTMIRADNKPISVEHIRVMSEEVLELANELRANIEEAEQRLRGPSPANPIDAEQACSLPSGELHMILWNLGIVRSAIRDAKTFISLL